MTAVREHAPPLAFDTALDAELVARAEADLAAADRLFAADLPELAPLLADTVTPLIAALAALDDRPPEAGELLGIVADNLAWLADEVEARGWPRLGRVGPAALDAAWLIAQHADDDNAAREALLPALEAAVGEGLADPRHLGCLVDRVALVDGEPQAYGTVVEVVDGQIGFPVPIRASAELDARRTALGLPPIADELPYLDDGDLVPFGADRRRSPLLAWPLLLEGHRSVEAALAAGSRPVRRILARRPGDRRLVRLRALARAADVPIQAVDDAAVAALATGSTHGGVVAIVGTRRPRALDELLAAADGRPLLVALDGVEDPFTYGQAVRALYAAGVDGLVLGPRSWESATATVARASAGTSELMPTAAVPDLARAVTAARAAGARVVCAVSDPDAMPIGSADLEGPLLVVIGGERRGIHGSLREQADALVRIPVARDDAPDLGAAAAAAIIGYVAGTRRAAGDAGRA